MQNLMPPVDTPDNLFHDGNPTQGIEGTIVTAKFLNNQQAATRDLQQEIINVLAAAGVDPDPKKNNQLAEAISAVIGHNVPFASLTQRGIVQLNSATNSVSEDMAATPKAVKLAMDNANNRLDKNQNGADIPDKARFIENLGLRDTVIGATDTLLGKNNTWTATNKFIGGLGVGAPAGSPEGGQIDLNDKDGGRAYFIDIDADGNFRVVRSGNDSGITTNVMFQLMRATNEVFIGANLNVDDAVRATGSIHAGGASMGTDGNIVGSIWNGGNLATHLSTIGGVKNVARGAQVAVGLGESTLTQSLAAPAGCFLDGFTHVSAGTGSNQFWRRALTQIFYRPVMINDGQRWLQIGDIA